VAVTSRAARSNCAARSTENSTPLLGGLTSLCHQDRTENMARAAKL
jgi:hypothetical protein